MDVPHVSGEVEGAAVLGECNVLGETLPGGELDGIAPVPRHRNRVVVAPVPGLGLEGQVVVGVAMVVLMAEGGFDTETLTKLVSDPEEMELNTP